MEGRLARGASSHRELNIQSGSKSSFVAGFNGFLTFEGFEEVDAVVVLESFDDVLDIWVDLFNI